MPVRNIGGWRIDKEDFDYLHSLSGEDQIMALCGSYNEVTMDPRKVLRIENQGPVGACFPAGTLVTLECGRLIPIEDVAFGHRVRTGKSRSRQVIDTMSRNYSGDLITIQGKGWSPIVATEDHRFWVMRDGTEQWVAAGNLVETDKLVVQGEVDSRQVDGIDLRDYVGEFAQDGDEIALRGSPTYQPYRLQLDELACEAIGLYVAEGSTEATELGTRVRVCWTLHEAEVIFADKVRRFLARFGFDVEPIERAGSKAVALRTVAPVLAEFLDLTCGRGSTGKKVPAFIMQGTRDQKMAFLRGYIDGDGSDRKFEMGRVARSGNRVSCNQIASCTTSPVLHQQLGMLCVSLGMKPGLSRGAKREARQVAYHNYLYGKDCGVLRDVKIKYQYDFEEKRQASRRPQYVEGGQLRKIRTLSRQTVQDVTVYDFEVDQDHSFCANGYVVHNCQGHSISSGCEWIYILVTGDTKLQLSRAYGYYESQRIDGLLGADRGSTIQAGVKLAMEKGICPEELWPYQNKYAPTPPRPLEELYAAASKYRIAKSTRLTTYEAIRTFLGSGQGMVHLGIPWGPSVDKAVVPSYSGGDGGHSIGLYALSDRKDQQGRPWLWMMNSWSSNWGNEGWAEWSPDAINQMLRQRWAVFVGISDMPEVKPREWSLQDTEDTVMWWKKWD